MAKSTKPSNKLSDRLNPKTVNQFGKSQSSFGQLYNNGAIPCKLSHGSVNHRLVWNESPESLSYDPLLVHFAEGLVETQHPYTFITKAAFIELCEIPGSVDKVLPLLTRLIPHIKLALMSKDKEVVKGAFEAVQALSNSIKSHLNPHLKLILAPFAKWSNNAATRDLVLSTLHILEEHGHKEAYQQIKKKIPTYTSICG
ncbi:PACRG-like protein [Bolinopsis microptera]|uniref:PACRG-like protein n=1 Tax=Bolinopsis microptera TaxID=2820187 RepID=UPI00307933E5